MAAQRTILIADDDPWVRKLLEFIATDLGFEPLFAADGPEALAIFSERLPDAAILDIVLPKVDGLDVSRRIKASGPGAFTPVVLISGIYNGGSEPLARSGADAFFPKPVSPELLAGHLAALWPPAVTLPAEAALDPAEPGEIGLDAQPLPLALSRIHHQRLNGVLRVRTRAGTAEITLRAGQIVQAQAPFWTETLGGALVRLGRIGPEQQDKIETRGATPENWRQIGDDAALDDLIPADLPARVWASIQMFRVMEAFRWEEGFHSFDLTVPALSPAEIDLDTPSLIHWGLRHVKLPATALEQAIPSRTGPIGRKPQAAELVRLLPLSQMETWLLERVDGTASFEDLWNKVEDDPRQQDALIRAAIALHALGAIGVDIPRLVPANPAPPVAPEALPEFEPSARSLHGSPADILLALWREEATGVLELAFPKGGCLVYLQGGQLVMVRGAGGERLDGVLAQRGRIRPEVLPQVQSAVSSGQNLGQALVGAGAIGAPQLQSIVRGELRAALAEALLYPTAEGTFTRTLLPQSEVVRHEWDTARAVTETVRSRDLANVRRLIPEPDALLVRRSDRAPLATALPLSPTERNLWNLLSTPQPWHRLAGMSLVPPQDQQRALFVLLTLGLVERAKAEAGPAGPPSLSRVAANHDKPAIPVGDGPGAGAATGRARRSREVLLLPDEAVPEGYVSRATHDRVLGEKRELERRLQAAAGHAGGGVPPGISRQVYEELLRDRAELKAQVVALMDEVIRIKSWGAFVPGDPLDELAKEVARGVTPKPDEGSVIAFKRSRK
jgi:CheY-like chemotaxis protein